MSISIYNSLNLSSHRAARAFLIEALLAPGSWERYYLETGRLEDGIAETLQAYFKKAVVLYHLRRRYAQRR